MRYDLPPHLSPDEERAVIAAMEAYFAAARVQPSPWSLAGRADALRLGPLQIRHQAPHPWLEAGKGAFAHRSTDPRMGRGDSK
ncbi:MAG TPA: hypothetical protein VKA30_05580 [Actinomycetota bacterium]|nr:hypothetical protein [Actinomycetota bacterium]